MLLSREILISTFPWGGYRTICFKKVIIHKTRVVQRYSSDFFFFNTAPQMITCTLSTCCAMIKDDTVFTLTHKYSWETRVVFPGTE